MKKRAVEQTGLIPRSIIRTFERFRKQLFNDVEMLVIYEFRVSRYQVIISAQTLLTLIFLPILINIISKYFFIKPLVEFLWNENHSAVFLNSYQQNRALTELNYFEQKLYFESFLNPNWFSTQDSLAFQVQQKTVEIAQAYNSESISCLTNFCADFLSIGSVALLFVFMKPQISILKSFLAESLYSLSDTTKSILLILGTDLLVGFHSPRGWDVFLGWLLRHFGLPEDQEIMSIFVATFPVFIDTIFKYWIFRTLNKISPSTVATYHTMIE